MSTRPGTTVVSDADFAAPLAAVLAGDREVRVTDFDGILGRPPAGRELVIVASNRPRDSRLRQLDAHLYDAAPGDHGAWLQVSASTRAVTVGPVFRPGLGCYPCFAERRLQLARDPAATRDVLAAYERPLREVVEVPSALLHAVAASVDFLLDAAERPTGPLMREFEFALATDSVTLKDIQPVSGCARCWP